MVTSANSLTRKHEIPSPSQEREELFYISQDFTKMAFASPHDFLKFKNKQGEEIKQRLSFIKKRGEATNPEIFYSR